jgi:hypothetical protein
MSAKKTPKPVRKSPKFPMTKHDSDRLARLAKAFEADESRLTRRFWTSKASGLPKPRDGKGLWRKLTPPIRAWVPVAGLEVEYGQGMVGG